MKLYKVSIILFIFLLCLSLTHQDTSTSESIDEEKEDKEKEEEREDEKEEEEEKTDTGNFDINMDEYQSPCEYINEDENTTIKSYDDCKDRSSEFIYEICCFLRGRESGENETKNECVDINRDDKIKDKNFNITKKKIMNGTYWKSWNGTYDLIETINCHLAFIYMKKAFILFWIFLF